MRVSSNLRVARSSQWWAGAFGGVLGLRLLLGLRFGLGLGFYLGLGLASVPASESGLSRGPLGGGVSMGHISSVVLSASGKKAKKKVEVKPPPWIT